LLTSAGISEPGTGCASCVCSACRRWACAGGAVHLRTAHVKHIVLRRQARSRYKWITSWSEPAPQGSGLRATRPTSSGDPQPGSKGTTACSQPHVNGQAPVDDDTTYSFPPGSRSSHVLNMLYLRALSRRRCCSPRRNTRGLRRRSERPTAEVTRARRREDGEHSSALSVLTDSSSIHRRGSPLASHTSSDPPVVHSMAPRVASSK